MGGGERTAAKETSMEERLDSSWEHVRESGLPPDMAPAKQGTSSEDVTAAVLETSPVLRNRRRPALLRTEGTFEALSIDSVSTGPITPMSPDWGMRGTSRGGVEGGGFETGHSLGARSSESGQEAAVKLSLMRSQERLTKKSKDLASLRNDIQTYIPGRKLLPAGDKTKHDYVIPQKTVLLLVGDMGAGKSTLVNNIHRAVNNTRVDLDIAATARSSTGSHSLLLQEYAITPRILVFDTRGLSVGNTGENVQLLKDWVKKGVTDSQAVVRLSDGQEGRDAIQDRVRLYQRSFCKRRANFAIYVLNAGTIHSVQQRSWEEQRTEAQRMRKIYGALHQFKDRSPIVVMTHGDQLLPEHRDSARLFIAETLGIDAGDSVFDIASFTGREQEENEVDPIVDAAILSMLQQALKLADRSMPPVDDLSTMVSIIAMLALICFVLGAYIFSAFH